MNNFVYFIQQIDNPSLAVYQEIQKIALKKGLTAVRYDTRVETGNANVISIINNAKVIISDISNGNPNVMYETGIAISSGRPIILISNSALIIPHAFLKYRVAIYDNTNIKKFSEELYELISKALNSEKDFLLEEMDKHAATLKKVIISYSHKDKEYLDRILVHLKPLEKEKLIELWVDTQIKVGDQWRKEISNALSHANVAILLISADFLSSDFIVDNELPPLLSMAEKNGTRIIPIILKPSRFERDKNLNMFQALNDPKEPILMLSEGVREKIYDELSKRIEETMKK